MFLGMRECDMLANILLFGYFATLTILSIYGVHRYQLVYLYYKYKKNPKKPKQKFEQLPKVTIQLPVFNELYVVKRLIDRVVQIKYPKELLEIQVLDDSTDETQDICREKVAEYEKQGYQIEYLHRVDRKGFKAGALEEGLKTATGEYVAIFDADFLPEQDFLEQTIHFFTDPKTALVQARWGHVNRDYSMLTEVQSIMLDGHLVVEQTARNRSGRFFNFNGTAGIWRKEAIEDAGGWHHETLTEDLDLSFRAQLKGWEFIFLPDVVAPAELPVEVDAFKSQQHRWAKGSVQVCRKLLRKLWQSSAPWKAKVEGTIQLTSNFAYLLMFFFCILSFPALVLRSHQGWYTLLLIDLPLFLAATISITSFYTVSQIEACKENGLWKELKYLPFVKALGIGLCINNTKAVIEALVGYKTGFVRTPKYNAGDKAKKVKSHYKVRNNILPYIETAFWGLLHFGNLCCISYKSLYCYTILIPFPIWISIHGNYFFLGKIP